MKRYEQFPHTADIGVRVFGHDLKELFENAAFAMFDLLADLEGLKGDIVKDFEIKASNATQTFRQNPYLSCSIVPCVLTIEKLKRNTGYEFLKGVGFWPM